MTKNALIEVEKINPLVLFTTPDDVDALIAKIEERALSHVPVLETATGRKEIASVAAKVARSKTLLDGMGKDLTADWKKKAKAVDVSRKTIRDRLDELKAKVRQPLTEWEQAEEDRIQKHKDDIETMRNLTNPNMENGEPCNAGMLRAKLAEIEGFEMGEIWEEFAGLAAKVKDESIAALKGHIERRETYEAEQAELERLRTEAAEREKHEYEERIAREAAEKARREAEERAAAEAQRLKDEKEAAERREREAKEAAQRAEQEAIEREKQAKRDRIAAEERAKAEKEAAVRAAEEKARQEAEKREKERLAKEAAEKAEAERIAANKNHRKRINREALAGLVAYGVAADETVLKTIIQAIAKGLIPHITINY
jgi:hypothetical protein